MAKTEVVFVTLCAVIGILVALVIVGVIVICIGHW